MGFFQPGQLTWGVLAIGTALLYVLWRHTPHQVASTQLWQLALARRSFWRRYQRVLSATLFVMLVLLLAGAAAEPFWRSERDAARNIVVILDTSASMQATDVPPSRAAWAQKNALRLVGQLRRYEQMAILASGGSARLVCGWSHDGPTLKRAIKQLRPTDSGDATADAVNLAHWMTAGLPNARIYVVSDGCFPDATRLTADTDLQFITPQSASAAASRAPVNYAITALAVRTSHNLDRDGTKVTERQLFVELANFSDRNAVLPLSLEIAGKAPTEVKVAIPAGGIVQKFFDLDETRLSKVTVRIKVEDDLSVDNMASLEVPASSDPPVVVASNAAAADPEGARRNLLNRDESNLQPVVRQPASLPPDIAPRSNPPGAWLLLGTLVLCCAEWVLFQRRVTV